jgi:hypothetical protein
VIAYNNTAVAKLLTEKDKLRALISPSRQVAEKLKPGFAVLLSRTFFSP